MNGTHCAAAVALLLALAGCADAPGDPQPTQGQVVATSADAGQKKICHREAPAGSNILQTVCRTAEDQARNQRDVGEANRQISRESAVQVEQRVFSGH